MSVRLDTALVELGFASGREKAKEYILNGFVTVNGKAILKPSVRISGDPVIECSATELYVGRGGQKLEKALNHIEIGLSGICALDVGASTGGFTDCMLSRGASKVFAVDVGRGQLHHCLLSDSRVCNLENTDIRDPSLTEIIPEGSIGFCCIDVAFISVTKIAASICKFLMPGAHLACLVKPQFEAGRAAIGKRGIVTDSNVHAAVIRAVAECFLSLGFTVTDCVFSPVTGGDGNIEYFLLLVYNNTTNSAKELPDFSAVVAEAHMVLLS